MVWSYLEPAARPLRDLININGESLKLNFEASMRWHTGLGMLGWLNMTCPPDIAHAYFHLGRHQANPTESDMDGLHHSFKYLIGGKRLISRPADPASFLKPAEINPAS